MFDLLDMIDEISWLISLITIALGLVNCFYGFNKIKIIMALNGWFFGTIIGAIIGLIFSMIFELSEGTIAVVILSGLVIGIAVAYDSYKFYKLGVFTTVALIVFVGVLGFIFLRESVLSILFMDGWEIFFYFCIAIIPSFIAGKIAVMFVRPVFIFTTAVSGAYEVAKGFGQLIDDDNLFFIIFILFAVLGIYIQDKNSRKKSVTTTVRTPDPSINPYENTIPDILDNEHNHEVIEEIHLDESIHTEKIVEEYNSEIISSEKTHSKSKLKMSFSENKSYEENDSGFKIPDDL